MIELKINNVNSFTFLVPTVLFLLTAYYAVCRDPLISAILLLLLLNFRRVECILGFFKLRHGSQVSGRQLTLIIFADGTLRLESGTEGRIAGYLDSNHWCTRHMAVIRVVSGGRHYHLLALSAQQEEPDNFRRLNLRLRQ